MSLTEDADSRTSPLRTLCGISGHDTFQQEDDEQEQMHQSAARLAADAPVACHDFRNRTRSPAFLPIAISQKPVIGEFFLERFIDAFSPQVDLNCGSSGTLRAAAGIRMFSPLLCDAFQATSTTFFGQSILDQRIETFGYKDYPMVLHSLQQALFNTEQSRSQGVFLTVAVLMCFEVFTTVRQSKYLLGC
jgi:hypothetical protein